MNAVIKTNDFHGGHEVARLRNVQTWEVRGLKGITLTPSQRRKFRKHDCSNHCACGGAVIVTDDGTVYVRP